MLLPHTVHLVLLSATVPNAREIAEWIADLHKVWRTLLSQIKLSWPCILIDLNRSHSFNRGLVPSHAELRQRVSLFSQAPCHVLHTSIRPTPLDHYVCPVGGDGLYRVQAN